MPILPKESSFVNLKIIRDFQVALSATAEEKKECGIHEGGDKYLDDAGVERTVPVGALAWERNIDKEITVPEYIQEKIKETLLELDKNEKITNEHLTLYEKFVGVDTPPPPPPPPNFIKESEDKPRKKEGVA